MRVFLGLGSNLGERRANLDAAVAAIAAIPGVQLVARAGLYESAPVGPAQPDFLNTAVAIESALPFEALLARCKEIEAALGRVPTFRWGPRRIDIDLLIADAGFHSAVLDVPHVELHRRRFALEPLCELAPSLVHPRLSQTLRALCDQLPDQGVRRCREEEPAVSGEEGSAAIAPHHSGSRVKIFTS